VQLVNAVAPFIFNARLKALMMRTPERDKHIVNVSAMEGQFYRRFKTTRHPHTNMAKAALNMMTRTSAADYHADGIHMNSVDTGWVTDEDPVEIAARKEIEQRFSPPPTSTVRRGLSIPSSAASTPARTCGPVPQGLSTN
jgi:NAD(P)-dependent dehydrogenase (short-subunit alcohol dehydrogenase family)